MPVRPAVKASTSSTLICGVQVESSPEQCSATAPGPSGPGVEARFQGGQTFIVSAPDPPVTVRSFTPPNPLPVSPLFKPFEDDFYVHSHPNRSHARSRNLVLFPAYRPRPWPQLIAL